MARLPMLETVTEPKLESRNTLRARLSATYDDALRASCASCRARWVCTMEPASPSNDMLSAMQAMIIGHGRGGAGVVAEVSDPCAVVCAAFTGEFYVRGLTPTRWFPGACS